MGSASSLLLPALADLPVGGVWASISSLLRAKALLQPVVSGGGAAVVPVESAAGVPLERKGAGVPTPAESSLERAASRAGAAAEESSRPAGQRGLRGSSAGGRGKRFLRPAGLLRPFSFDAAISAPAILLCLVSKGFA